MENPSGEGKLKVSAVIPAYREAERIAKVVTECRELVDEVIVVDDGSDDSTGDEASRAGAKVVRQPNSGQVEAIKNGFRHATCDIVVTIDADGEHHPSDIRRLVQPIINDEADMVLGSRQHIARFSERVISAVSGLKAPVRDTGTGFRAIRSELALKLKIPGTCICGTSVLEAYKMGARIREVPVTLGQTDKPRRIAWNHFIQLGYVIKMLIR